MISSHDGPNGEAVLSFEIRTRALPDGKLVGAFLLNIADAYSAFVRRSYGPRADSRLVLRRIGVGSVLGELLAVAGAIETLLDHREILAGFMTHVQESIEIVTGAVRKRVPKATKTLLGTAARAVVNDPGSQLILQNYGNIGGSVTINITGSTADRIVHGLEPAKTSADEAIGQQVEGRSESMWQLPVWSGTPSSITGAQGRSVARLDPVVFDTRTKSAAR